MRVLISIILILFGLSAMIAGGVEIYSAGDGTGGMMARISYILGAVVGAGLVLAGPAIGKNQPWGRLLALVNLAAMTVLSIFNAVALKGHINATQHATRALLALFLILSIIRLPKDETSSKF